ncbi:hypothetical protein PSECIP111951_02906 [Pseudoalteromonas holothuriae]|uniref:Uncharacterized protein n=1 Tax=Pseudoalteromonas holothuriae TaxID=2963714 RepID=A0A9W4QZH1_9GAMM|nr:MULTISPECIES: DUF6482 family protein [unclassified Pseudoalteromonas]CAH9060261.1 hypothetical protein PSECIP111854_02570 [Pseudoalteromonas sp. CIP111854]CAH9063453.1 hypothetical protein PSECIP111951_02906 [Pseudoalteromonas sp. CIP111951]
MRANELKSQLNQHLLDAIILSYADANHYLAGGIDPNGNYHLLSDELGRTMTFNSLREAEVMLASLGVGSATFEMQTAYDEMVGSPVTGSTKTSLTILH